MDDEVWGNWQDEPTTADKFFGTYEYTSDLELNHDYVELLDQAVESAKDDYEYEATVRMIRKTLYEKAAKFVQTI